MRKKNQNSNPNVSLIATLSATKTLKSLHNDNTTKKYIYYFFCSKIIKLVIKTSERKK